MSSRTARRIACGILLTGLTPLAAQETKLSRDVAFVRKLATDLGFTALAKSEVERLQVTHKDSGDFKEIFQLGIEISLIGARSHPNREERRTLFKAALQESKEFIDRYAGEPVADRARRTMIEACYEYGAYLLDEIALARDEAPDQVAELEEQAGAVYQDGIDACDKVMDRLSAGKRDEGSEAQRDYYVTWLFKAMLQREKARAVKRDRGPLSNLARDTFEEFIFEVGEESLLGLRGWFEMSRIGEVLGNFEVAFDDFQMTIESIHSALDEAGQLGLSAGTQEYIFNLLQEAYDKAADALFQQGKVEEALAFVDTFRADLKKYGEAGSEPFDIAHPTYGHPVFLTEARALSETGEAEKVAQALELAQKINDAHPNDIIGLRAKGVLKEILEIQSHSVVTGALLFEVAKGEYQAREYERAIQGFKRAYGAMTDAEKRTLGLETWLSVAKSFGLQRRYLEAALAAKFGLENHREGAPENLRADAADVLEKAWQGYLRDATSNDVASLRGLKDKVTEIIAGEGGIGSEAKLRWREAGRLLDEKKYAEAAATFAMVPKNTPYYEPAQARIVVAWQGAEDHARARQAMQTYLDWLGSPEAAIPADQRALLDTRNQALATLYFYDAFMDYLEVVGRVGGAPDRTRFEPTIAKLRSFIDERGKDGPGYVPNAWDMIARLHAELGQFEKADESYRTLRRLEPNSPLVPNLATAIFSAYYNAEKAMETEYAALIEKGASPAEIKPVADRLVAARRKAVGSGLDYLENAAQPDFSVLFNTLTIASDNAGQTNNKDDWAVTERVGRKLVELFGEDPKQKEFVEKFVSFRLGEALLRQRKFRDAVTILQTAADANPSNYPVKRLLSLAQGGWYEFNDRGGLEEVIGLDQPAEAYRRHWTEYQKYLKARGVADYSLEWYQFECECFMFAARAARKDSDFERLRGVHFRRAQSVDNFAALQRLGPEGQRLLQLFQAVR
jgi:tetratricopeptide (TPR) repeat protein